MEASGQVKMRQIQYKDFIELLRIHKPVEIKREHIKKAKEEKPNQEALVDIAKNYPTINRNNTNGYILPSEKLPFPFGDRLIHFGVGTERIHNEITSMLDEMIQNAIDHGNMNKPIYLLWHKCGKGKEVYIVNYGEKEFDINEKLKRNTEVNELTGLDILIGRSKYFEFFNIINSGKKKGTLLRIILEQEKDESCTYIGHKLFKTT